VLEKKVSLCLSEEIWQEYVNVLNRDRFSRYREFKIHAEIVLGNIEKLAKKYYPDIKLSVIRDETDNRFLELAVFANADFLITGNTNDFTFAEYQNVKIINPSEYWKQYTFSPFV